MDILVVGLVHAPQVGRLREEAERRGHTVDGCFSNEITLDFRPGAMVPRLRRRPMAGYDVYFFWAMDRYKHEWFTAVSALHRETGAIVVDRRLVDPRYHGWSSPAVEYVAQTRLGLRYPRSAMLASTLGLDTVLADFDFPVIVKGSLSRQGRGVHLCSDVGAVRKLMKENEGGYPAWIVREFIPNDGDVRVFTVGYKAIGAMKRTAKAGDFRSNISQGATGAVFDLEAQPEVRHMAEAICEALRIEVAGVDIMLHRETGAPYLLEINSGPEIAGIERYTGANVAGEIVEYFEALAAGRFDPMAGLGPPPG